MILIYLSSFLTILGLTFRLTLVFTVVAHCYLILTVLFLYYFGFVKYLYLILSKYLPKFLI